MTGLKELRTKVRNIAGNYTINTRVDVLSFHDWFNRLDMEVTTQIAVFNKLEFITNVTFNENTTACLSWNVTESEKGKQLDSHLKAVSTFFNVSCFINVTDTNCTETAFNPGSYTCSNEVISVAGNNVSMQLCNITAV